MSYKYRHKTQSVCPRCGAEHSNGRQGRYCRTCQAIYVQQWRKKHPLNHGTEAWAKDISRSKAGVYLRRGKIEKKPCESCGAEEAEMHHEDYDKPLDVIWLCRTCHLALHKERKAESKSAFLAVIRQHLGQSRA